MNAFAGLNYLEAFSLTVFTCSLNFDSIKRSVTSVVELKEFELEYYVDFFRSIILCGKIISKKQKQKVLLKPLKWVKSKRTKAYFSVDTI
jgi:hypothetical protein